MKDVEMGRVSGILQLGLMEWQWNDDGMTMIPKRKEGAGEAESEM